MADSSRRRFLKQGLAAGGGLLVSTAPWSLAAPAQAPAGSKMRLGLVTYQWGKDWDLPTLLTNCAATRFLGVELRTQHAHGVEDSLNASQRAEVKRRFADSPVELVGMGCNFDFHHTDPAKVARNIEGAKAYAKLSADCGGSGVKVKPNALPQDVPVDKTCEQIGKALNQVGRYAGSIGQEVRVEVHGRDTSRLPIMKKIFDWVTEPAVGVCWNCNAEDLAGRGLVYNFNLVKHRFGRTCHVREFNIGDYPYQDLIGLFVRMNYAGWILLEARTNPKDRIQALREQYAVFERMRAQAQAALAVKGA